MCEKIPTVSFNGIDCVPMSGGVLFLKDKHKGVPWYMVKDNGNGISEIDITDKNGIRVSFSILTDSEAMKNLLVCDPFGKNQFEVKLKK